MAAASPWTEQTAVHVSWPSEEYEWLRLHPCLCGGAWELSSQHLVRQERNELGLRMTDRLEVRCDTCGRDASYWFVVQYEGDL